MGISAPATRCLIALSLEAFSCPSELQTMEEIIAEAIECQQNSTTLQPEVWLLSERLAGLQDRMIQVSAGAKR